MYEQALPEVDDRTPRPQAFAGDAAIEVPAARRFQMLILHFRRVPNHTRIHILPL